MEPRPERPNPPPMTSLVWRLSVSYLQAFKICGPGERRAEWVRCADLTDTWVVRFDALGGVAERSGPRLTGRTPAMLWRALARESSGRILHLIPPGAASASDAVAQAADYMQAEGLDAVLGRVAGADELLSRHPMRIEAHRYLKTEAGALLVRGEALARIAEMLAERAWDADWPADLVMALSAGGLVGGLDKVFCRLATGLTAKGPDRLAFRRASPEPAPEGDEPLILIYGALEASVSVYFDGLPRDLRARLRFLRPGDLFSDLGWLASAGLVVVVRHFEPFLKGGAFDLLREIGVPFVWFTDDDLIALRDEEAAFRFYSKDRVQAFLAHAAGVVTTSPALVERLAALHDTVLLWPCVYDPALAKGAPSPQDAAFTVGVFGGAFRRTSFVEHVLPALGAPFDGRRARIIAAGDLAARCGAKAVEAAPFEPEYRAFVGQWRRLDLAVVAHPCGVTGNIDNKSRASLLTAAYLGAAPVVGLEPAHAGLSEAEGVMVAGPEPRAWRRCFERLADPHVAAEMFHRLDAWCRSEFDPEAARAQFEALASLAVPGGADASAERWQRAGQSAVLRRTLIDAPTGRLGVFGRLKRSLRKRWAALAPTTRRE